MRGTVDSAGGVVSGTGFTVDHPATGHFVVNYTTPFGTSTSEVTASLRGGSGSLYTTNATDGSVDVHTTDLAGTATDHGFTFSADATV